MRVVFRTDASTKIGAGHVMRCLALAAELRARGAEVQFVCRSHDGHLADAIQGFGIHVHLLPIAAGRGTGVYEDAGGQYASWLDADWQQDVAQTQHAIGKGRLDWVVVDHYALDAKWEAKIRTYASNVMVIDDLADRHHDCDLLLDQNFHEDAGNRYRNLVPAHCDVLLGGRFALLRSEFAEQRARRRARDGRLQKILVLMGGADPRNVTARIIGALKQLQVPGLEHVIVVGAANRHTDSINEACRALPNASVILSAQNIASLLDEASLCIGAGGVSVWERFCLGVPGVVIPIAANQVASVHALAQVGKLLCLEETGALEQAIVRTVSMLASDPLLMTHLEHAGFSLVDGRGVTRVAGRMMGPFLRLRRAEPMDRDPMLRWRNAEVTRRHSADPSLIHADTHTQWFTRSLCDDSSVLLIAEIDSDPVGVLRFDFADGSATVSVYLVPERHGQGLGAALLKSGVDWIRASRPDTRVLRGHILASNIASANAFIDAGFSRNRFVYERDVYARADDRSASHEGSLMLG
jgi:UDP-2,4-diacetamido-2,4,6-trideoxy-beta-L-altropyranose hydrolase